MRVSQVDGSSFYPLLNTLPHWYIHEILSSLFKRKHSIFLTIGENDILISLPNILDRKGLSEEYHQIESILWLDTFNQIESILWLDTFNQITETSPLCSLNEIWSSIRTRLNVSSSMEVVFAVCIVFSFIYSLTIHHYCHRI